MTRLALLVAAIAVATSGCFYLTAINERPRARIQEKTSGPYQIGDVARFSATGSSDDSAGQLQVTWQAFHCDAANVCTAGDIRTLASTASDFEVTIETKGTLRVELTLEDEQTASDKTTLEVPVVNREPSVEVQITSQFPETCDVGTGHVLGLPIHIAAQVADGDMDPLTTTWSVEPPAGGGSNPDNVTFEPAPGETDVYQLIGDVAGTWEVTVTTADNSGASASAMQEVVFAPDGPPCLERVTPAVGPTDRVFVTGAAARRFAVVSACDSLDPYPALLDAHPLVGRTQLSWSLATPATGGQLVPMTGQDLGEVVIDPASYASGDQLTLRVEATDRRGQPVSCPANEPTCSEAGNSCLQRVTWEIEIR